VRKGDGSKVVNVVREKKGEMGTAKKMTITITITIIVTKRMTIVITKNRIKITHNTSRAYKTYVNFILFQFKNARKPYNFRESFHA
jgi:hypothetical protein